MNAKKRTWLDLCRRIEEATGPCPKLIAEVNALIQEMYPPRYMECQDPVDGQSWYVTVSGRPDPQDLDQDEWFWTGTKIVDGHYDDDTYQYGFRSADEAQTAAMSWFRVEDLGTLDIGGPIPDVPRHPGWFRLEIRTPSRKHPHGRTVVGRTWHVARAIRDWMAAHGIQRPPTPPKLEPTQPRWGREPQQERIYSLTPLDIGFDPRAHDMPIELPAQLDGLRLERHGRTYTIRGTREELITAARAAGYRIAE